MKKPIFIFLSSLLLVTMATSPVISDPYYLSSPQTVTYTVTNTNSSASYAWYNSNFTESWRYSVSNNTNIDLKLNNPSNLNTKLNLTIGNLTRNNILDSEADANLGIGYWNMTNVFGFISSTNWSTVSEMLSMQNFVSWSFDGSNYTLDEITYNVMEISFEDNFQKTSLVYHMNTGLLFSADIVIGGFTLSFDIKSLDPSLTVSSSSSMLNFNLIIYFNISMIAFYILRTKLH